jgi:hypothetical protein
MNRAFLLLGATATMLSGCFVATDSTPPFCGALGAANFYWQFQDGAGALHGNFTSANPGCFEAGVDGVDILVDGQRHQSGCVARDQSGALSPAIQIANLTEGAHSYELQGYRGNELVFSRSGTVVVPCGLDATVDVTLQALNPQSMVIYYSFAGNGTFCPANVASMSYWLYPSGSSTAVAQGLNFACDPASRGFTVSDSLSRPLPLVFASYAAILEAYDSLGRALYVNCNAPLSHDGAIQLVDLAASSVLCP